MNPLPPKVEEKPKMQSVQPASASKAPPPRAGEQRKDAPLPKQREVPEEVLRKLFDIKPPLNE